MSQELLSEQSFHERCYIPPATLKRAEGSRSVSNRTLRKFAVFFGIGADSIVEPELIVEEVKE